MSKLKSLMLSNDPVGELWDLFDKNQISSVDRDLASLRMDIPKGYHHKNVLDHSIRVLDNALSREPESKDLILRTAALFHDIGKPATREFHGKGKVTFTNHDVVGAKMIRKILPHHGYSKSEIQAIGQIVFMHMRSHTFKSGWTESAVRRLSTQAGSDANLERLIVIFKSDATTKDPKKVSRIVRSVDELSEELSRVKAMDARAALRPALNGHEVAELFGLTPGRELGAVMRFLNSDEMIGRTRAESIAAVESFLKF